MRDAHKIGSILHFWPIAGYPKLTFSRLSRNAVVAAMISAACWRASVAAGLFRWFDRGCAGKVSDRRLKREG